MRRYLWTSLLLALPSLVLFAAEGEGHGAEDGRGNGWTAPLWGVPTLAWQLLNLALVVVLLVYLLRKPAPKFFADRAKAIEDQLRQAVREKEEAVARLGEVEARMAALSQEVAAIEREAVEAAEQERIRIRREAEEARERIRRDAAEDVARRVGEAKRELQVYAADLAVQAAHEILARELGPEDEERLAESFLASLKGRV